MYSRPFTAAKVAETSLRINRELQYYKYDYIRACVSHLDDLALRDDKGRVTGTKRPLAPDESDFIYNERLLCGLDYLHWAESYHYVRHAETLEMIPFRQNSYQKILTLAQGELEEGGKPIMVDLLKARQGGGTTDTTSKIEHRMLFVPNTAAVIASSDPEKSWKLSEMISRSLVKQPWWLIPPGLKEYQSGEVFLDCFDRNSYVSIQHGTQGTGISRGDTVNCYHLSEIPDFDNPELIIDASLFGAWHPTPLHFGVRESTAKGRKNYWHRTWLEDKENWPKGLSMHRPLFLPYYVSLEIYPTETWLAAIPIPKNYEPTDYVKEHARRAEEYVASDPFLLKVFGEDWRMPLATKWWYQFSYDYALRKDKLADFLSEYCSTDTEAFQSMSKSVFSIQLIQSYEAAVPQPAGVFKLTGDELPGFLAADSNEIFHEDKRITIHHNVPSAAVTDPLEWNLTPIRFPGYSSVNSHLNTLWIWEYPLDEAEYCVSLDGAQGIGRDRTVANVLRKGTPDRPAGQVACFSTDNIGAIEIWPICLMLLNYYSTWNAYKRDLNKSLFSPETASDGASCLMEVRKRGWNKIYFRRDRARRDQGGQTITKLGWETTQGMSGTRKMLISWIIATLKGRYVEVNSPWTIDEMRDFVVVDSENNPNNFRVEHDKGCFPAGALITLATGEEIRIERVNRGGAVLTHQGRCGVVTTTFTRAHSNKLFKLKVAGLDNIIETTPNHPFLVKRRKAPRIQTGYMKWAAEQPPVWVRADLLKKGDLVAVPKRPGLAPSGFTEDQLYAMGLWLAEGNFLYGKWTGNPCGLMITNTDKALLDRVKETLDQWFPAPNITKRDNGNTTWYEKRLRKSKIIVREVDPKRMMTKPCYVLEFRSAAAAIMFSTLFGEGGCAEKSLHSTLYQSSGLLALVSGFVDGDGSQRKNQQRDVNIHSTSRRLMWQMRQIMIDSGVWCTIRQVTDRGFGWKPSWVLNVKASYLQHFPACKIVVPKDVKKFHHTLEDEFAFYTPIRSIEAVDWSGIVYNLEVAGDNSYIVGGAAVHNSHDDELFALGIGTVTLHDLDIYRGQTPQWRAAKQEEEDLLKFATYKDSSAAVRFDAGHLDPETEKALGALYPTKIPGVR